MKSDWFKVLKTDFILTHTYILYSVHFVAFYIHIVFCSINVRPQQSHIHSSWWKYTELWKCYHSYSRRDNWTSKIIRDGCSSRFHRKLFSITFQIWWWYNQWLLTIVWVGVVPLAKSNICTASCLDPQCTMWLSLVKFPVENFFPPPPFSWDPIISDKIFGDCLQPSFTFDIFLRTSWIWSTRDGEFATESVSIRISCRKDVNF